MKTEEAISVLENKDVSLIVVERIGQDPEYWRKLKPSLDMALSALRAQQEKENNAPLTLDEMREMGGEPYYHVSLQGGENHWAVLDPFVSENIDVYDYGYGKRWIAYRHKPEEESHV